MTGCEHHDSTGNVIHRNLSKYFCLDEEEITDDIIVVRPDGAIYIPEAEQFDAYMRDVLERKFSSIILNFSRVKQLPSLVFATIIQTYKECQAQGGDLRLCAIPPSLMRVFVTMQFDRIFKIFDDEAETIQSFQL